MGPKRLRRQIILFVILFVFLAPVIPDTVPQMWLLPWWGRCYGLVTPDHPYPGFQPVQVYASISYVVAQLIIHSTTLTDHGLFGLVVVPNNGWDTVQFPPIGFGSYICN